MPNRLLFALLLLPAAAHAANPLADPARALFLEDFARPLTTSPSGQGARFATTFPFGGREQRTIPENHEAQCYTDATVGHDPFTWSPGRLVITAAPGANPCGLPYTSGLLTTFRSFAFLYGYAEFRVALPVGAGSWPGLWLLPQDNRGGSELDVLETFGTDATHFYATRLSAVLGINDQSVVPVSPPITELHTYGVDWRPDTLTWYLDGRPVVTKPTPANMNTPMYLLVELAITGPGGWRPPADATTPWPLRMRVEHIGVYRTDATVTSSALMPSGRLGAAGTGR